MPDSYSLYTDQNSILCWCIVLWHTRFGIKHDIQEDAMQHIWTMKRKKNIQTFRFFFLSHYIWLIYELVMSKSKCKKMRRKTVLHFCRCEQSCAQLQITKINVTWLSQSRVWQEWTMEVDVKKGTGNKNWSSMKKENVEREKKLV